MGQAADEVNLYTDRDDADDTALDSAAASAGDDQDQSTEEPEQIRAQIEDTRAEMSSTIDAIQEKLNPDNLKEQAKDAVREATVGRVEDAVNNAGQTAKGFGADMLETIKQNPLPAALAGIGIGWLLMKRNDNASRRPMGYGAYGNYNGNDYGYNRAAPNLGYRPYDQQYYGRAEYGAQQQYGSQGRGGGVGQVAQQARETLGDVAGTAGDKVGQIGDKVGDVGSQVGDTVGQLGDKVGDIGEQAQYRAERAGDWFGNTLQENPLAIGAVAIAVGAAVGLLLPETPKEHQIMGEARDNLMNQAQDAVQNTVQKVQRVADQAQTAVKQEAQNQGLVGDANTAQV